MQMWCGVCGIEGLGGVKMCGGVVGLGWEVGRLRVRMTCAHVGLSVFWGHESLSNVTRVIVREQQVNATYSDVNDVFRRKTTYFDVRKKRSDVEKTVELAAADGCSRESCVKPVRADANW